MVSKTRQLQPLPTPHSKHIDPSVLLFFLWWLKLKASSSILLVSHPRNSNNFRVTQSLTDCGLCEGKAVLQVDILIGYSCQQQVNATYVICCAGYTGSEQTKLNLPDNTLKRCCLKKPNSLYSLLSDMLLDKAFKKCSLSSKK